MGGGGGTGASGFAAGMPTGPQTAAQAAGHGAVNNALAGVGKTQADLNAIFNPTIPTPAIPPTSANAKVAQSAAVMRARSAAAAGSGFGGTVQNQGGAGGLVPSGGESAGRSLLG